MKKIDLQSIHLQELRLGVMCSKMSSIGLNVLGPLDIMETMIARFASLPKIILEQPSYVTVDSIYLKLWNRNHCNHRDYQNIAVDGARSGPMADTIINTTARDPKNGNSSIFSI